jgi:dTDP-4-dehydrorhamnose 3,5-epimerase
MRFEQKSLAGLIECFPSIFHDERGLFFESFNEKIFKENGIEEDFVQDNHSWSKAGVIRGLHFQYTPYAQGKLVRCVAGKVLDVVVDIRPQSPTFGQHASFVLDSQLGNMLYVPVGFAHGFRAIEDSIFAYKCTNFWHKASESGIVYNDPALGIDWGIDAPIVSGKDLDLPLFEVVQSLEVFSY